MGMVFTFLPLIVVILIFIFYGRLAGDNWWMRFAIGWNLAARSVT
jgi:hypothetical protein